jgi:hypothetical protein
MTLQRRDNILDDDDIPFSPAKEAPIYIDEQEASMVKRESAVFGQPSQTSISMVNQECTERKTIKKPVLQLISQSVNKNDSLSMFDIGLKPYNTEVKGQKPNL